MVCNYSSMRDVFTKRFEVRERGNGLAMTSYKKVQLLIHAQISDEHD